MFLLENEKKNWESWTRMYNPRKKRRNKCIDLRIFNKTHFFWIDLKLGVSSICEYDAYNPWMLVRIAQDMHMVCIIHEYIINVDYMWKRTGAYCPWKKTCDLKWMQYRCVLYVTWIDTSWSWSKEWYILHVNKRWLCIWTKFKLVCFAQN